MDVRVEHFTDLDAVEADAAGDLDRDGQAQLFDRLSWFRISVAHLPGLDPLVLRARSELGSAWLPLSASARSATQLGRWYTLRFGAVFSAGTPEGARAILLEALMRSARDHAATLVLSPLDERTLADFVAASDAAGWVTRSAATSANWSVASAGCRFADYWRKRPGRLRATVSRKTKLAPLSFEIRSRFDADAWAAFERVFAASWKPAEGSAAFLRALAEQEGRAGTLRLGIARLGEAPVAAQLWLVENGVATIHKLAHDRAHDALSPGTLLTVAMMEAVIDGDRPARVDFGTGDDRYKTDWMTERAPLHTLEAADPRQVAGLARIARWRLARLVRGRRVD